MNQNSNLGKYIVEGCQKRSEKNALVIPQSIGNAFFTEEAISFACFLRLISAYQEGLKRQDIRNGDRFIFIARPSIDMYAMLVACICSGVIPVFVDTGMGKEKILMAIEDAKAVGILATKDLLRYFYFLPKLWPLKRFVPDGVIPGCKPLDALRHPVSSLDRPTIVEKGPLDHCLITFTSGTTGRPKGADRTHGCLVAQHMALEASLPFNEADVSISCFPVAALHQIGCGVTTLLPRANLAHIADFDPQDVIEQISQHGVTVLGSAPAFLTRLMDHLSKCSDVTLPSLKKIIVGGASVPNALLEQCERLLPDTEVVVVYGSTESEPITTINSRDILSAESDGGYLVGFPVKECNVRIIPFEKGKTVTARDLSIPVKRGSIGEIIVSGEHVLRSYIDNPEATAETKIDDDKGSIWHLTGDLGYWDKEGRLWLVGRDKDVIWTGSEYIYSYQLEKTLDQEKGVIRSAIVEYANGPALVAVVSSDFDKKGFNAKLELIYSGEIPVFCIDKMPVDGRHNSKIDRVLLRDMLNRNELAPLGESNEKVVLINSDSSANAGWDKNTQKPILIALGLIVVAMLWSGQDSLSGALYVLLSVIYIQIPLIVGGVGHMIVVSKDMLPSLKVPINRRLFGANKTWRGVLVVPAFSFFGALVLMPFEYLQKAVFGDSLSAGYSLFMLAFVGAIGYILGELPNSYLKRRMGIAPGGTPDSYRNFFIALDQIDSGIGVFLLYWLVLGFSFHYSVIYLCFFPVVALVVKHYLYKLRLKDVAR